MIPREFELRRKALKAQVKEHIFQELYDIYEVNQDVIYPGVCTMMSKERFAVIVMDILTDKIKINTNQINYK